MTGENLQNSQNRNNIFSIVATGDRAKDWVPYGYSIGCNDAWRWGKPTDALLLCNRPVQFTKERFQTIINSKPSVFYSHKPDWAQWFPDWKRVRLHAWAGSLHKFQDELTAYKSDSSPIVAITLAYSLGAKEIILWGVDFKTHHIFNDKNPAAKKEVHAYLEVFQCLREQGVIVYRGADGSVFDDYILKKDAERVQV